MIIDHIVTDSYKGKIHKVSGANHLHYGPQFHVIVNKSKPFQLHLRAEVSYNISVKGVFIKPYDEGREKRLKKAFKKNNPGVFVEQFLELPEHMLEFLNMFKHNYKVKKGSGGYREEVYPLYDNVVHVCGSDRTVLEKLKKGNYNLELIDLTTQDEVPVKKGKVMVYFGMSNDVIKHAGHRFVIDVILKNNYKKLMEESLSIIKSNQDIDKLLSTPKTAYKNGARKYGLVHPFLMCWDEYSKNESAMINEMLALDYILAGNDRILRSIKKLL